MISDGAWIALTAEQYGRKTINEVRAEAGMAPVADGGLVFIDWLKNMSGIPLRPDLRVVPMAEDDKHALACGPKTKE